MTLSRTDPSDPINLHHAFMSASFELITTYCFAKSHKAVDDPHFSHPIILALDGIDFYLVFFATTYIGPILELLVFGLPLWLAGLMSSKAKAMQEHFRVIAKQVEEVIEDREMLESADHETVFHHLLMPLEKRGVQLRRRNRSWTRLACWLLRVRRRLRMLVQRLCSISCGTGTWRRSCGRNLKRHGPT